MIEMNIVSNLCRFPDDHAHAVVNEKTLTNPGPWVNLNAG
jgi:hypothetical protein